MSFNWRKYCRNDEAPEYYEVIDDCPDHEGNNEVDDTMGSEEDPRHAAWCKCPDCLEEIGDWKYHQKER